LIDTVGGQVQMTLGSLIQTTSFLRSGKLRALAVSGAARSSILPNVPTIAESGVPGYQTANWWGVAAPRGTPAAVVNRLNQETRAVLQTPDTEKRFISEGAEPVIKTPAELGKYVADEMAKWKELARIAGIRGE
jgi:tripartite-type tricarboxylate transporter receptor subunit TctC